MSGSKEKTKAPKGAKVEKEEVKYLVAENTSVTSKVGIKLPGEEVTASIFVKGEESIKYLLEIKALVKK